MNSTVVLTPAPTDRFGRAFGIGASIVYPTRRGSVMELISARVVGHGAKGSFENKYAVVFAKRTNGSLVTLRNLHDVVVIP